MTTENNEQTNNEPTAPTMEELQAQIKALQGKLEFSKVRNSPVQAKFCFKRK
jgi:uncharacterized FlaG/YvyC family protein